jgi:hypothetical protein
VWICGQGLVVLMAEVDVLPGNLAPQPEPQPWMKNVMIPAAVAAPCHGACRETAA